MTGVAGPAGIGLFVNSIGHAGRTAISGNGDVIAYVIPIASGLAIRVVEWRSGEATNLGGEAGTFSIWPSISADGRFVSYETTRPPDVYGSRTAVVFDRANGSSETLRHIVNQSVRLCRRPSISGDGRYVAMECTSGGFGHQIVVRDRAAATAVAVTTEEVGDGSLEATRAHNMEPSISADGRYVAFQSFARNLSSLDTNATGDVYVHDRLEGRTHRVSTGVGGEGDGVSLQPTISASGNAVAFVSAATQLVTGDANESDDIFVVDLGKRANLRVLANAFKSGEDVVHTITVTNAGSAASEGVVAGIASGRNGVAFTSTYQNCETSVPFPCRSVNSGTRMLADIGTLEAGQQRTFRVRGRVLGASVSTVTVESATWDSDIGDNSYALHVTPLLNPADTDGDGLPNEWELRFGLNPNDALGHDGADGDPDADGVRNEDEYARGTHPRGFVRRFLAEGTVSTLFETRLALLNPTLDNAVVTITTTRQGAPPLTVSVNLPTRRRVTLNARTMFPTGQAEFSTELESDREFVLDRTMTWDTATRYGSHAETAVAAPSTVWYLAEGATHSGFNLFYLLQNPAPTATSVRVRYLRPSGVPLEKAYTLPPASRTNIWVNVEDFAGLGRALAATDVSAVIETLDATPIIVERAMYLSNQGRLFNAGHASMGVTAPATEWFLAEGATGPYFDLFVLIANPNDTDAQVTVTYLLVDGTTYSRNLVARANSRSSIWVDQDEIAGVPGLPLADAAISTTVKSTNGVPLIVERAMWWPGASTTWHEAHNSAGSTETGTRWALAEGEVGGPNGTETYILIANTSAYVGNATVTLLFEDGTSAVRTYTLAPLSRTNVATREDFGAAAAGKRFGAIIETTGATPAEIVVERAMYSNAAGVRWAAGTNALATRLP